MPGAACGICSTKSAGGAEIPKAGVAVATWAAKTSAEASRQALKVGGFLQRRWSVRSQDAGREHHAREDLQQWRCSAAGPRREICGISVLR